MKKTSLSFFLLLLRFVSLVTDYDWMVYINIVAGFQRSLIRGGLRIRIQVFC